MVRAGLISMSLCRKRAEVVVQKGNRSITRHVHRNGGTWIGRNTDEEELKEIATLETELSRAHSSLREAKRKGDPLGWTYSLGKIKRTEFLLKGKRKYVEFNFSALATH